MKNKLRTVLAVSMLAGSMAANAAPVSWLVQGTLDTVTGSELPGGFSAGSAFSVVVNFNTGLPYFNPGACGAPANIGGLGTTCRFNDLTVHFSDLHLGTFVNGDFVGNSAPNGNVIVRNNVSFSENGDPLLARVVDGLTFNTVDDQGADGSLIFQVVFRGPQDLGLITDASVIPTDPQPGLLGLDLHVLQICSSSSAGGCDLAFVSGTINSVSRVPEPATLGLLGLALAGVGFGRRKRLA